jgi:two-component system sensor histidine kinase UhpB
MRRLAWGLLAALATVLATSPFWLTLPQPEGTLVIAQAVYGQGDEPAMPVTLPHRHRASDGEGRYALAFRLDAVPAQPLYLYLPLFSQSVSIAMDGRELADTQARTRMMGITSGAAALVRLPADRLAAGTNTLQLRLRTVGVVPGYLGPVHIGTTEQLAPHFRLKVFLLEQLRLMIFACQLLLAVAVLIVCFYRPREPVFRWLFALLAVTLLGFAGLVTDLHPGLPDLMAHAFIANSAGGFILLIVMLLIVGLPVPRWLVIAVVAVPGLAMLLVLTGAAPTGRIVVAAGVPAALAGGVASVGVAAWGAFARRDREAQVLLLPLLITLASMGHDMMVATGRLDSPVFLAIYYRPLTLIAIAAILMRRLGLSLRRVDEANTHLSQRLAQREAELAALHAQERQAAARRVRAQERQRLTVDLHDGLSGHLASIIALAERERAGAIEQSAREALDDLRVVIHSLDIGDRELGVALAGLRERLEPQLRRLGIVLDWSVARLPDISGVTPAHALGVLRIVQEAVTNAVKHGPARRVAVRGEADAQGRAVIEIENDGAPANGGRGGAGLPNMHRRAALLGGALRVEALARGTVVTLVLPATLPDSVPADEAGESA